MTHNYTTLRPCEAVEFVRKTVLKERPDIVFVVVLILLLAEVGVTSKSGLLVCTGEAIEVDTFGLLKSLCR